jgi:hypothetical protein
MNTQDLMEEFDPLFSSNTPATPADKKMNENDKLLDAFGIKKQPTAATTSKSNDNNPFADFADLGAQPAAPVTNPVPSVPLDLNLLMETNSDSKNALNSANFPVMSAEMLCPQVPNNSGMDSK